MSDKYAPCPCGSGKKFKFCCFEKRETLRGLSDEALAGRAAEFPIDKCFIGRQWQDRGLAQVLVTRQLPDGTFLMGIYLVDVFCLGIKDAMIERLKPPEMRPFLNNWPDGMEDISYEDARSVILGAVEFAARFGFTPAEGWSTFSPIIESDRPFIRKFSFGRDGKPFYIQGPYDDTPSIMKQLAPFVEDGTADHLRLDDSFSDDIDDDPDDETLFEAWVEDIGQLLEDGEFEDAKSEIEDLLQDCPHRWEPLYLMGTCLALEGKAEEAIPLFHRANDIQPSADSYFNLANAHRSLFNLEEWIACLRRVIELDGDEGDLGKDAKADLDDFASSIQKDHGVSLDRYFEIGKTFELAFAHLSAGRFEVAVSGFSEVLKAVPGHVQSYGNLGLAYAALGKRGQALECLEKAISLDPGYEPAITNLRVLRDKPTDEPLIVEASRKVDFYADRARERSTQRPGAMRGRP